MSLDPQEVVWLAGAVKELRRVADALEGKYENEQLTRIEAALARIEQKEAQMAGELDALTAEVARNTEVDQSAITLLNGLSAKIEELKNDPAKLQAFADSLKASSDSLAAAVVANTPAEPPPPPPTP